MKILVKEGAKCPTRGTKESAGLDFYVPLDFETKVMYNGDKLKIPSGVSMVIPEGKAGIFFNKSSHGSKGLFVGACVVDSDYRGEVHLDVHYLGDDSFIVTPGMKIVQMLLIDVQLLDCQQISKEAFAQLCDTERGSGGFGSTGA